MNHLMYQIVQLIITTSNHLLMPLMVITFLLGAFLRWVIFFTVKCEHQFAAEFEKRVHKYLAQPSREGAVSSFHQLAKKILENTYYETFELKHKYRRRRFDHVTSLTDRIFLIQDGVARLIKDALSQTVYLRKGGRQPKFLDISKFVFGSNPVFNKVFALFPMGMFNDILNVLPGLFVIGGIFGNFIGVMQSLPTLSHMDISDVDATKRVMDAFILNMAFSMGTSIIGILLSVLTTLLNTIFSPDSLYVNMVNKFSSSMEFLWNDTTTNEIDETDLASLTDRRGVIYANPAKQAEVLAATAASQAPLEASAAKATGIGALFRRRRSVPPPATMPQGAPPIDDITDPLQVDRRDFQREPIREARNAPSVEQLLSEESPPKHAPKRFEPSGAQALYLALEQKLVALDAEIKQGFANKTAGIMSDAEWDVSRKRWASERYELLRQLERLKGKRAA